jgi:hypothetical protein
MRTADAIFVPANAGAVKNILGMTHVTKVSPQEDGAACLALELSIPAHAGPPLHHHAADSETFFVLHGTDHLRDAGKRDCRQSRRFRLSAQKRASRLSQ